MASQLSCEPCCSHSASEPPSCQLCNASPVRSAGFVQRYGLGHGRAVHRPWWECPQCRGWFVYPHPDAASVQLHWGTCRYTRADTHADLFQQKAPLLRRVLQALAQRGARGTLLDVGSNYGDFLHMARRAGWQVHGFEPFAPGAAASRAQGLDVRGGWALDDAGFGRGEFDVITVFDSFYYAWHPHALLKVFGHLLKPGGWLVMRVSNKRTLLGWVRKLTRKARRGVVLTELLQGQFHSVDVASLEQILRNLGFSNIGYLRRALVVPWGSLTTRAKLAYMAAEALQVTGKNLAPGVLIMAQWQGNLGSAGGPQNP